MTATNSLIGRETRRAGGRGDGASRAPARPGLRRARDDDHDERLASFLGWFSIGLGLTQVLAPRRFARFIGVRGDDDELRLVRLVGLRELASGVGILTRPRPAGWLWARVAGDVMDLALLGSALASGPPPARTGSRRPPRPSLGVTALDLYDAVQLSRAPEDATGAPRAPGDPT